MILAVVIQRFDCDKADDCDSQFVCSKFQQLTAQSFINKYITENPQFLPCLDVIVCMSYPLIQRQKTTPIYTS